MSTVNPNAAGQAGRSPSNERVRLSDLLNRVRDAVSASVRVSVWTMVEVSSARSVSAGHWYLDVAERDRSGKVLAQARAIIWGRVAQSIVPSFARSTGVELAPGVKLLVRARPEFHAQYGFSLNIDAIDPSYTLGELEAKRRHIRARLKTEGLFEANRSLPPIWDYTSVLVLAPYNAAGLGDFQAEATRLERHGLCTFVYVHSRFQGEGAPGEMIAALDSALEEWAQHERGQPDAVVIIRGGGSTNDLAWLDDYALTKFICTCSVPVLTGIGHGRDNTLLDEVAHRRYDTPSKVIGAIEQHIGQRAREAEAAFQVIETRARQVARNTHHWVELARDKVSHAAFEQLDLYRRRRYQLYSDVCHRARDGLRQASANVVSRFTDIRVTTQGKAATLAARLPTLLSQVSAGATRQLNAASKLSRELVTDVRLKARDVVQNARTEMHTEFNYVSVQARDSTTELGRQLPVLLAHVTLGSRHLLTTMQSATEHDFDDVTALAQRPIKARRQEVARSFASIKHDAFRILDQAFDAGRSLMREIATQGPDKTLRRGFAIVRNPSGRPVTTAMAAHTQDRVNLQFVDGTIAAKIDKEA